MERDQFKFRPKARIVAFVDLILSSMFLCLCLIMFVGLLRMSSMTSDDYNTGAGGSTRGKVHSSAALDVDISRQLLDKTDTHKEDGDDGSGEPSSSSGSGSGADDGHQTRPYTGLKYMTINPALLKVLWTFLALISIMTAAHILAAVRLLNATQIGKDPVGAMKLCRFWRRVCIFFSGLLVFNFLSSFRQRGENFFEVSFLMTLILVRMVALYIVQHFINELDVALASTLPFRRHHHPTTSQLAPSMNMTTGDNVAYAYGAQYTMTLPNTAAQLAQNLAQSAPPPKYEDVVKEPYKFNEA